MIRRDKSAAYERLRQRVLSEEALCRYCLARDGRPTPATMVDHVIALAIGGSNDRDNLAGCCGPCNAAKSVEEARFVRAGYDPRDILYADALGDWVRMARTSSRPEAGTR